METDTVPHKGLMWPILSLPQLKVDPYEDDLSKTISWSEEEKVLNHLESKREECSSDDEFNESAPLGRIKTEKEELLDQKEYNLCLESFSYVRKTRTFNNIQAESNDGNCSCKRQIKSEFIEQEELHIKDEDNNEDVLKREKNYDSQGPFVPLETIQDEGVYITGRKEEKENLNKKRQPGNQLELHQCPECPYSTCRKGNLKIHFETHNSNKLLLKCSNCSYETSRPSNLKRHLITHKPNIEWLHCPECSFKTHLRSYFQRHFLLHKNDAFKCTKCNYQTGSKYLLKTHQTKHESMNNWHSCPLCPFKTYNKSMLKRHCLRLHNTDLRTKQILTYKCIECSYQSGDEYQVKAHQLIHDQKSWMQCPDCAYKTPNKIRFKEHQVRHQGKNSEGWYRCAECTYKTPNKGNLRIHIKLHKPVNKIQRFECSQCGFKTAYKHILSQHEGKHKEPQEIDWFCCYKCSFKSMHKNYLRKHMLTKHPLEIEWFCCYECSFKSIYKNSLRTHILAKHKKQTTSSYETIL